MRGRYQIVVKTRKIQYSFWINRNITIIQGDSAREKRYFTDLLTDATKNTIAAYNKDKLNNYYWNEKFYKRVLQECPELAKQFSIENL